MTRKLLWLDGLISSLLLAVTLFDSVIYYMKIVFDILISAILYWGVTNLYSSHCCHLGTHASVYMQFTVSIFITTSNANRRIV